MASDDLFDGIHMHDMTGQIMSGGNMVEALKAMDKDVVYSEGMVGVGDTAQVIIPRHMTTRQVIAALFSHWLNQQQQTTFIRVFPYRPHDGALAAYNVLRRTYGFVDGVVTETPFGPMEPKMITVHTGVNDTAQVCWGDLYVATLAAKITFTIGEDDALGTVFRMEVTAPRRLDGDIAILFASIEAELAEKSIYRGKIIKVGEGPEPEFVDLSATDPAKVIYNADVERTMDANLWAPMRRTEEFHRLGLPLKQAVLAYGQFGTGKSLAGWRSALIAVENGWTAILAESGDSLREALELAAMLGQAFVFCEDIDTIASAGSSDIESVLEMLDGVATKGNRTLLLATTNNVDNLHAGVVRPGRFDVLVEFGMLDAASIGRLIRAYVQASALETGIDFGAVAKAMTGFTPAFMAQAVTRARKYALLDGTERLSTEHLVAAADEMRPHLALMNAANTAPVQSTLEEALTSTVAATVGQFRVTGRSGGQLVRDPAANNGSGK